MTSSETNAIDVLRDYIRLDGSSIFAGQREAAAALDTLVARVDTLTRKNEKLSALIVEQEAQYREERRAAGTPADSQPEDGTA